MYEVIYKFADMQDNKHVYNVGDKFPYDDKQVDSKRIKELSSKANRIGKPLIKEVKKDVDVDGNMSGTEKLVRPGTDEVSRKVRSGKRKSEVD